MTVVNYQMLRDMSEDSLLNLVKVILARPGDYTPDELEELSAINVEFQIRYNSNQNEGEL